jgi:hypothetical protein
LRKPFAFLFLACAGVLRAQSSAPKLPTADAVAQASFEMEMFRRAARENNAAVTRQAIAKREAQIARTQFCAKANHFVELWMDFANHLNDKQIFDAKLAKKLAKAFHELETSDGWPVREPGK